MKRLATTTLGLVCLALAGCVEGEQTFTLNPDGSGKVRLDVVMAPPFDGDEHTGKELKDETLDDLLQRSLRVLLKADGVTAWKDVSAGFSPDGRFKFAGTAYFKSLGEFSFRHTPTLGTSYEATAGPDGSLTLAPRRPLNGADKNTFFVELGTRKPEELARMPDAEVDAFIMTERVRYQTARPLLVAMLTDARLKTTFVLPGNPDKVRGLAVDGNKVSYNLDGAKAVAAINKFYTMEAAALRKVLRSKEEIDALTEAAFDFGPNGSARIVVTKTTGPQFDYDKEVKEARAAYPELRKKLKLGEKVPLPEEGPPKK